MTFGRHFVVNSVFKTNCTFKIAKMLPVEFEVPDLGGNWKYLEIIGFLFIMFAFVADMMDWEADSSLL